MSLIIRKTTEEIRESGKHLIGTACLSYVTTYISEYFFHFSTHCNIGFYLLLGQFVSNAFTLETAVQNIIINTVIP